MPIGTLAVVWSPDSKSLLFQDGDNVKRIQVPDGAPEIIGRLPAAGTRLVTVSESGAMLFSCCQTRDIFSLLFVQEVGAEAKEIRVPGLKAGSYGNAVSLPGGEDFLIEFVPQGSEENEIYLVSLRDGNAADPALLMRNAAGLSYTTVGGRVLFVRNDNLYLAGAESNDSKTGRRRGARAAGRRNAIFGVPVRDSGLASWPRGAAGTADDLRSTREGDRHRRPTEQHRRAQTVAR